jgi:hypothetical protein
MRGARTGRMLSSVSDHVVHIAIDVSFADEQIYGRVADGTRQPQPFSGWLGLIGALDQILGSPCQTIALPSAADPVARAETGASG